MTIPHAKAKTRRGPVHHIGGLLRNTDYPLRKPQPNLGFDVPAWENRPFGAASIEFLQFADRMMFVATQADAEIALLYQGALGRTPDVAARSDGRTSSRRSPLRLRAPTEFQQNYDALAQGQTREWVLVRLLQCRIRLCRPDR